MASDKKIHYGATPWEWDQFSMVLGLDKDLLPCVSNPNAKISPLSDMKKVGKTPSRYNKLGEAVGITKWTEKIATLDEIDRWSTNEDYGICLQTRLIRGLDGDITDKELSKALLSLVIKELGLVPVRLRLNSTKFLAAFTLPGNYSKRAIKTKHGIIEFLATGQQFVAAGMHESGTRYEWAGGLPDAIPTVTPEQFEKLWARLVAEFAVEPPTDSRTRKAAGEGDAGKTLTDDVAKYLAEHNFVLELGRDGQVYVDCPWKAEHTVDNGPSQTAYFCAGTRGYEQGHFKCLHAHCAKRSTEEFLQIVGYGVDEYEDVSTPGDETKPKEEKKKKNRFPVIRADEFSKRPPPKWLIKGIIPERAAGMTYGGSGDGKTFVVFDQACAVALGVTWNGCKVKRGHVTYVCAEGAGSFTSRIKAYALYHDIDLKDLGDYLTIVPAAPNFLEREDVIELAKAIYKQNGGIHTSMIVIDTLAQTSTGADENSAKDMGVMMKNVKYLRDLTGSASHLIHHTGKDETRGARGSTSLKADLDFQAWVSREGSRRLWWNSKMKDAPDNFGWYFNLHPVMVGTDEDGEAVISCVALWEPTRITDRSKEAKKRGLWEEIFLKTWETLGGMTMPYTKIITEALHTTPIDLDEKGRDRRRERLRRAMDSLTVSGEIVISGVNVVASVEV